MKAGTTWLYSLLERHPQIQFTPEKEIHFLAANYINPAFLSDAHRQHRSTTRLSRIDQLKSERQERIRRWYHDRYLNQPTSLEWYFNLFEPAARRRIWNADFSNLSALIDADNWKRLLADLTQTYARSISSENHANGYGVNSSSPGNLRLHWSMKNWPNKRKHSYKASWLYNTATTAEISMLFAQALERARLKPSSLTTFKIILNNY